MFIDLSVPLNEQTPIYPGDRATKIDSVNTADSGGFTDHYICIGNHTGTHIDAPRHMIADGQTLDQFSVEQFVGRGRLVDARDGFTLEQVKAADIQPDDIVLFYTGTSQHYHEPMYFESYPAMSDEIARYVVECKVKMVGVDTCSIDNRDGFPVHKILLGSNVLAIENLTNLEQLVGKNFTIYALPLKLDVDGAPARVIAQVD